MPLAMNKSQCENFTLVQSVQQCSLNKAVKLSRIILIVMIADYQSEKRTIYRSILLSAQSILN